MDRKLQYDLSPTIYQNELTRITRGTSFEVDFIPEKILVGTPTEKLNFGIRSETSSGG